MKVLMTRICIYDDLCFTRLTFFLAFHPRLCLVELAQSFRSCFLLRLFSVADDLLIACDTSAIPYTTTPLPALSTSDLLFRISHKFT